MSFAGLATHNKTTCALERSAREDEAKAVENARSRRHESRRRTDAARAELAALANQLDRLAGRCKRLAGGAISALEARPRAVRDAIVRVEDDPCEKSRRTSSRTSRPRTRRIGARVGAASRVHAARYAAARTPYAAARRAQAAGGHTDT
jgi:hypothetical protein